MKDKYLELIEELTLNYGDELELIEELTLKYGDELDEFLNDLYKIIHLARGRCENHHEYWQEYINKKYFDNK